jgi:hypothetical protein
MSDTKRAGLSLLVIGVLGAGFFLLTDPKIGVWKAEATSASPIDAAKDGQTGTYVGVIGSGVVLAIGCWLLMKRPA